MAGGMMPIKPVSKDLLYVKVADAIHDYIFQNKLQPGDKLPSERTLAEQLQTGRHSVREALRVLENQGIIEVKTSKGAFVADKSSPGSIYLKLIKVNYSELLEIKAILERDAMCKVAATASGEQLDELDGIMAEMEQVADSGVYPVEEDKQFHYALMRMCGNKSLEDMVTNLIEVLSDYALLLHRGEEIFITTIPYHRDMLEAMKRRDVAGACAAYARIQEIDVKALERVAKGEDSRGSR